MAKGKFATALDAMHSAMESHKNKMMTDARKGSDEDFRIAARTINKLESDIVNVGRIVKRFEDGTYPDVAIDAKNTK